MLCGTKQIDNIELLIKIEKDRKNTNFLNEQEIKKTISEIDLINNGDFYLRYKNLLENKLKKISLQKELDILKMEYNKKDYFTEHMITAYESCIVHKENQIKMM